MTWISLSFVATAHSPFKICNDLGGGEGQAEVDAGGDDQRLANEVGSCLNGLDGGHDLHHTDGPADGGLLDDGDELVRNGGQDVLDGLGQNDVTHVLDLGHAQAAGSLGLAAVDGLDARADDLGKVSAGVQAQGDDAGDEALKADKTEDLPGGQVQTGHQAQNAAGSAERENQKYMESIQGHLDVLTNKWQQMWDSAINAEFINFFIDAGSGVLDLVNKVGLLQSAIAALGFGLGAKQAIQGKGKQGFKIVLVS